MTADGPADGTVPVDPVLAVVAPDDARAEAAIAAYLAELAERFPQGFDVDTAQPAPLDLCVLASRGGEVVGVGGLMLKGEGLGEVKRMWVAPTARGRGLGRRLLAALEEVASERGCTVLRLDTNEVLPEAIRLYETSGYEAVAPFNDDPYPTHFFRKSL